MTPSQPTAPLPSRRAPRWLAWLVAFMLFPGASEALTDLGHLVFAGHVAHAADVEAAHADHDASAEHGCSGLFHTCRCCPAPVVLVAPALPAGLVPRAGVAPEPRWTHPERSLEAHTEPPFRPPAS